LTAFVFHGPTLEPGNYARKHKNRENELNKLLRMNDLTFLTLENELGLMCKIRPIQAKKLEIRGEEIEQKRLSGPGAPQHERVGGVAVVEIEEIRRVMIGLEDRQIFPPQVPVLALATVQGEKKGVVGVVGVGDQPAPDVERVIGRDCGEVGVKQVTALFTKLRASDAEVKSAPPASTLARSRS
jgi:hypothetical protein